MNPCVDTSNKNSWGTPAFRKRLQEKLRDVLTIYGSASTIKAIQLENMSFNLTNTKEEYLQFIAGIIKHVIFIPGNSNALSLILNNSVGPQETFSSIQIEEPAGSSQRSQMPINLMTNQMNISINSPSATVAITSPKESNGLTVCKVDADDKTNIPISKPEQLDQRTLSMSQSVTDVWLGNNQMELPGPMRIKPRRALSDQRIARYSISPFSSRIQLRSQAPYQLLRHNASGGSRPIIRGFPIITPVQNVNIFMTSENERAYQNKVKELGRYVEPIKKMISILGSGEIERIVKLKRLLEILCSPHSPRARTTMEALCKIEVVLKKLDEKVAERQTKINEHNRLIEDISSTLQKTSI